MTQANQISLSQALKTESKTPENCQLIFQHISKLPFFSNFLTQNPRALDSADVVSLCQGIKYETVLKGKTVYKEGDEYDDKFYIVVSGQLGLLKIPPNNYRQNFYHKARLIDATAIDAADPKTPSNYDIAETPTSCLRDVMDLEGFTPVSSKNAIHTKRKNIQKLSWKEVSAGEGNNLELPSSVHGRGVKSSEKSDFLSLRDFSSEFIGYAALFGKLVRNIETGETFGDCSHVNNKLRPETALSKTNCELLVIVRRDFEQILNRRRVEKEEFLKGALPVSMYMSTLFPEELEAFFSLFQGEVYNKGAYLITEGKKGNTIFIVHQGECLIEKIMKQEIAESDAKESKTPNTVFSMPAKLAIVGKGMIIGEEVLSSNDEYNYSVKALSDNVVLYKITKAALKPFLYKDLRKHIIQLFKAKEKQREITFENAKKEFENSMKKQMFDGRDLRRTSHLQVRTKNFTIKTNSPMASPELLSPSYEKSPISNIQQFASYRIDKNKLEPVTPEVSQKSMIKSGENSREFSPVNPETKGLITAVDLHNSKKRSTVSKLKFLSQTPEVDRSHEGDYGIKIIEQTKLFDDLDPRVKRIQRMKLHPSNSADQSPNLTPKKQGRGLADFIITGMSKRAKHRKSTFSSAGKRIDKFRMSANEEERLETNVSAECSNSHDNSNFSSKKLAITLQTEPDTIQLIDKTFGQSESYLQSTLNYTSSPKGRRASQEKSFQEESVAASDLVNVYVNDYSRGKPNRYSLKSRRLTAQSISNQERASSPAMNPLFVRQFGEKDRAISPLSPVKNSLFALDGERSPGTAQKNRRKKSNPLIIISQLSTLSEDKSSAQLINTQAVRASTKQQERFRITSPKSSEVRVKMIRKDEVSGGNVHENVKAKRDRM